MNTTPMTNEVTGVDYSTRFPHSVAGFEAAFPNACLETTFAFFEGCLDTESLTDAESAAYDRHLWLYAHDDLVRDRPTEY